MMLPTLPGNIEEIHACHTEFLASLQPASEGWTEATVVSEPFLTLAERLDIYIPYCNNFDEAKATLAKCKKIAAFTSFLEVAY